MGPVYSVLININMTDVPSLLDRMWLSQPFQALFLHRFHVLFCVLS